MIDRRQFIKDSGAALAVASVATPIVASDAFSGLPLPTESDIDPLYIADRQIAEFLFIEHPTLEGWYHASWFERLSSTEPWIMKDRTLAPGESMTITNCWLRSLECYWFEE